MTQRRRVSAGKFRVAAGITILSCAAFAACIPPYDLETTPPGWVSGGRQCGGNEPAFSLSKEQTDSLPADVYAGLEIGARARLAREIPGGWGGEIFLDQGVPSMYLVDLSQRTAAIAALNAKHIDGRMIGSDVRVRRGRWSLAQLYDWYRYIGMHLRDVKISGEGIHESENRLVYSVPTQTELRKFEQRLSKLSIPCFLVAVEIRGFPTLGALDGR